MLLPKRIKHRKQHRGKNRGTAHAGHYIAFGDFAIQATGHGWITSRQIEAARRSITNYIRRGGKVWIRIFPDHPVTAKPAETRMGSGKGAVDHWVAVIKPGRVLFELSGVREDVAKEAMRRAGHKLPIETRFIVREKPVSAAQAAATALVAEVEPVAEAEAEAPETEEAAGD